MLKKRAATGYIVDKLHKGFVITCIAVTCYGMAVAGYRAYNYFTVTRPMRKAQELQQLKLEGEKKAELNG